MQLPDLQDDVDGGPYLLYNRFEVTLEATFSINLSPSNKFKQKQRFRKYANCHKIYPNI